MYKKRHNGSSDITWCIADNVQCRSQCTTFILSSVGTRVKVRFWENTKGGDICGKWNLYLIRWRPFFLSSLQVCVDNVLKTMKENANKASSILLTAIPQISQMDWTQTMKTLKVSWRLMIHFHAPSLQRSRKRGCVYLEFTISTRDLNNNVFRLTEPLTSKD